ncbi:MAG: citrate lyase holo-[acyl-carrier protein] synthase [Clostridium sp.]|nr:citrate lyase holo-[acyl-carrier protein] synthase [Clostridium sp.]
MPSKKLNQNYEGLEKLKVEKLCDFEKNLIKDNRKTLIVVKVTSLIKNKDTYFTKNIVDCIETVIYQMFNEKIDIKIFRITTCGPVVNMIVDMDADTTKEMCAQVEDKHILGPAVDILVYDSEYNCVSRSKLKLKEKKCLVCSGDEIHCIEQNNHSQNEIIKYIKDLYKKYKEEFYGESN